MLHLQVFFTFSMYSMASLMMSAAVWFLWHWFLFQISEFIYSYNWNLLTEEFRISPESSFPGLEGSKVTAVSQIKHKI